MSQDTFKIFPSGSSTVQPQSILFSVDYHVKNDVKSTQFKCDFLFFNHLAAGLESRRVKAGIKGMPEKENETSSLSCLGLNKLQFNRFDHL